MKRKFGWDTMKFNCRNGGLYISGEIENAEGIYALVNSFSSTNLYVCTEEKDNLDFSDPNYETLARILKMAYNQAAEGKGKERHANGEKFEDQPIMTIAKGHGLGYQTGQAAKKLQEAHTLLKLRGKHAAIQEILGAINYAAAAVLLIEQMEDEGEKK